MRASLRIISAHILFEIRTAWRSWFFRIFSLILAVALIIVQLSVFSDFSRVPWLMKALPGMMPYALTLIMSIAQVPLLALLTADSFKRDRRSHITQVIYARSMTNLEYVLGKTLGVLAVFIILDIIILLGLLALQMIVGQSSPPLYAIFWYCFIFLLTTSVFTIGISAVLMQIIRNQAVTVILVLAYGLLVIFTLGERFYGLFDFMAFRQPVLYSQFMGFAEGELILGQRLIYLLIGLAGIFFSSATFNRLSQSNLSRITAMLLSISFAGLSLFMAGVLYQKQARPQELRAEVRKINGTLSGRSPFRALRHDIHLTHRGNRISSTSSIVFQNTGGGAQDTLLITLNPGLRIKAVRSHGQLLESRRQVHIAHISLPGEIPPGAIDSLSIEYEGTIDNSVCSVDVPEDKQKRSYNIWIYKAEARQSVVKDDYILLPPEALWYPQIGLPLQMSFPSSYQKNFIHFNLDVQTSGGLQAISQGRSENPASGKFVFRPEQPLPFVTLIIGRYEQESVASDDRIYNIFHYPGHDYYREYFSELGDTLAVLLDQARFNFERRLQYEYPFARLSLVEVPIQYYGLRHLWTVASTRVQPEQVWLPEMAAYLNGGDLKNLSGRYQHMSSRMNIAVTKKEEQASLLRRALDMSFLGSASFRRRFMPQIFIVDQPEHNLFATYYTHVFGLSSEEYPLLPLALESFLFERVNEQTRGFSRFADEITEAEQVSMLLQDRTLEQLLAARDSLENIDDVLRFKGTFFIRQLLTESSPEEFDSTMAKFLKSGRFRRLTVARFFDQLKVTRDSEWQQRMENWISQKELPGFEFSNVQAFKFLDVDRIRYQVLFTAHNAADVDGILSIRFRTGNFRQRMLSGSDQDDVPERIIKVEAGKTNEVGIVLDAEPRALIIDPLLGRNLPLVFTQRFEKTELRRRYRGFDGVRSVALTSGPEKPGEIIVDNDSPGFELKNRAYESLLKRVIQRGRQEQEQYERVMFWRPPGQWALAKNAEFYGRFVHSARLKRNGDGQYEAIWKASLPRPGSYAVYVYIPNRSIFSSFRRRESMIGELHYRVVHEDGTDEISIDAASSQQNWIYLGNYFFGSDSARVIMNDESNKRLIIADAVKWVRQN